MRMFALSCLFFFPAHLDFAHLEIAQFFLCIFHVTSQFFCALISFEFFVKIFNFSLFSFSFSFSNNFFKSGTFVGNFFQQFSYFHDSCTQNVHFLPNDALFVFIFLVDFGFWSGAFFPPRVTLFFPLWV